MYIHICIYIYIYTYTYKRASPATLTRALEQLNVVLHITLRGLLIIDSPTIFQITRLDEQKN